MKLLVGLVTLLCTISFVFAAPVPTTEESNELLLRRAPEDESNAVLFRRSPEPEPEYEVLFARNADRGAKKNQKQNNRKVDKEANIRKNKEAMDKKKGKEKNPKPAKITWKAGAAKVLKNNKPTNAQFNGKNPKQYHENLVKLEIANNPKYNKATKALIAAPLHQGGTGGGGRGPDQKTHMTVKFTVPGRGAETAHVYPPEDHNVTPMDMKKFHGA